MTSGASSPSKSCWTSRTGASAAWWAMLIGCWGLVGFGALIWVAARLASGLAGGACESFGTKFIADVGRGRTSMAWPRTPTAAVVAIAVVLLAVLVALVILIGRFVTRRLGAPADPVAALARNPRMRALTRLHIAREASGLRRSLAGADPRAIEPAETGLALG